MKKSYLKILIYEIIIFFILILNSFESSILSNYKMPAFILVLILIFKFMLGFEKDKFRYKKDLIINLMVDILIYFIAYYLLGIVIGFAKNENYLSLYGIVKFIIPLTITIISKEYLRYGILRKSEKNKLLIISTTVMYILFDISAPISILNFKSGYDILVFMGLTLFPSISKNILLSFVSIKEGYKPTMVYLLCMSLPMYILPIIPNPNIYLKSIIDLVVPALILANILQFYKKSIIVNDVDRDYKKRAKGIILIPLVLTIILVYFVSGYFRYYAIAVASGSMSPVFNRGSVVVVDQKYDRLEINMIIAFKTDNKIVIHRIVNIASDGNGEYYYTKGDANKEEDNYRLTKNDIIGVVKVKIPFVGYPTVVLSEL